MENGVIKTYKKGRSIICYIRHYNGKYTACTGKPSDPCCLSWNYDNIGDAENTAALNFGAAQRILPRS